MVDTDRVGTVPTVDENGINKHPRIVYNIYIIINIYILSLSLIKRERIYIIYNIYNIYNTSFLQKYVCSSR